MIKLSDMKVGSIVLVRTDFGTGRIVEGTVEALERDIKNGIPGIDYKVKGDKWGGSWAYLDQVQSVVRY